MSVTYEKHKQFMEIRDMFSKIISKWLDIRNDNNSNYWHEYVNGRPRYVIRMVREINKKMPTNMLNDVFCVESRSAGHTDYFDKFSLYCAELYVYGKSPLYWD